MIEKVGSEAIRDCRNEELMRRLEDEARMTAAEEICDEIVESVTRLVQKWRAITTRWRYWSRTVS